MTTRHKWPDLEAALDTILSLPERDWHAACLRLAGDDDELCSELLSLVACIGGFDPLLDRPVAHTWPATPEDSATLTTGARIGAYRILNLIGRGGMGEVYLAERADGQFEHRVALKLITREAAADVHRFKAERQILARLEHPGIARLLDAGLTDDARPYMVMELVVGEPIIEWCRERGCGLAERLRLFMAICDAVAYAHRNLIVHRDLKPANVLVTQEGAVKLLDFGVAKVLEAGRDEQTQNAPLTPAYAAPEQLTRSGITTATDVYALGLLLFELLTGERPWHLANLPLVVGLEKVLHETAPRTSEVAARTRNAPIPAELLRGDLDAIVSKALRKEPEHRYETVAALQLDVARSERAEPVAARTHARVYVFNRFLRRHRVAAATGAFVLLLVVAAGIAVMTQAHRAAREAARATATRNFLVSVFSASDPRILSEKPRGQITAKELLDANATRIQREFSGDPPTEIELLRTVAAIYRELNELDRYAGLRRQMLELARSYYGNSHPLVLEAELDDATFANGSQNFTEALQVLTRLDPLIRLAGLDRSRLRARWWLERGVTLNSAPGVQAQAQRLDAFRRSAALFHAVAPEDPAYVTLLSEIGTLYVGTEDLPTAIRYFRQAIEAAARVHDRDDGELQTIYANLGLAQQQSGDYVGADISYTTSEAIAAKTYGRDDRRQWQPLSKHARTLHLSGERQRALSMFASVEMALPPPIEADYDAAVVRELHGSCLASEGRPLQAIPLLEGALKTYEVKRGFRFDSARARLALGNAYDLAGRESDARTMLKEVLEERIRTMPADSQALLAARERWGRFLLTHADPDSANEQFLEVVAQDHGRRLSHVALAYGGLASVALRRNDIGAATDLARRAVELFDHVQGFRDVRMGPYLWRIYAQILLAAGDAQNARRWAQRALDADRLYDDPSSADISQAEETLRATTVTASP